MNGLYRPTDPVDTFGMRVAARLEEESQNLPYVIVERLRASRVHAVNQRKRILAESSRVFFLDASGALTVGHGDEHSSWWNRLGAAGLLLTLVLGLVAINVIQDDLRANELADIDAALLTDDLPPAAYVDPGFMQFLIFNHQEP